MTRKRRRPWPAWMGKKLAGATRAADETVFRTKITVSRRASPANRAGSFLFHEWAGRQGPGPSPHSAVGGAYDHDIPEAAERNEAHREAQDEGRKARAAKAG